MIDRKGRISFDDDNKFNVERQHLIAEIVGAILGVIIYFWAIFSLDGFSHGLWRSLLYVLWLVISLPLCMVFSALILALIYSLVVLLFLCTCNIYNYIGSFMYSGVISSNKEDKTVSIVGFSVLIILVAIRLFIEVTL